MKTKERNAEQKESGNITTDRVQCWTTGGTMATAQMTNRKARELVKEGRAFVVSNQAIGMCDDAAESNRGHMTRPDGRRIMVSIPTD